MQISSIGLNNGFKGYDGEIIDVVPFEPKHYPVSKLDKVDFQKVVNTMDEHGADRKTAPVKFFIASAALTLAAFVASRATVGLAMNKLNSNFGTFDKIGEKVGSSLSSFIAKHPHKEGKGVKIYFVNKATDIAKGVLSIGKKSLDKAATEGLSGAKLQAKYAGEAVRKGVSAVAGVGVAGATIQSRYEDTDQNGIPDKAENALSTTKEIVSMVPALVDAVVGA